MSDAIAKIGFLVSVVVLSVFYGYAARSFEWFPHEILDEAYDQFKAVLPQGESLPTYVIERTYDRSGARTMSSEGGSGLTLITSAWVKDGKWTPGLRLIDGEGRSLHEWRVVPEDIFDGPRAGVRALMHFDLQGSYLFPNGDILTNVEWVGLVRLDACSRVVWKLEAGNHHSISRADDGTFWVPAVTEKPRRETPGHPEGLPGVKRPVYQDLLLHVDEHGAVLDTINVLDVLYENDLSWHLAEEQVLKSDDPTHLNDIDPLPDSLAAEYPLFESGDLAVSLRNLDLVLVLGPSTGEVKWSRSGPWIYQHDPDWLGEGWIGVFDNRYDGTVRGTMLGGSRIVAVEAHTDSTRILFPTSKSDPFYTRHRGKWQLLGNGNMLLTEQEPGRVVEVAPDGETVWEWIYEPSAGDRIPSVSEGTRVDVTPREVAGWSCGPQRAFDRESEEATTTEEGR